MVGGARCCSLVLAGACWCSGCAPVVVGGARCCSVVLGGARVVLAAARVVLAGAARVVLGWCWFSVLGGLGEKREKFRTYRK